MSLFFRKVKTEARCVFSKNNNQKTQLIRARHSSWFIYDWNFWETEIILWISCWNVWFHQQFPLHIEFQYNPKTVFKANKNFFSPCFNVKHTWRKNSLLSHFFSMNINIRGESPCILIFVSGSLKVLALSYCHSMLFTTESHSTDLNNCPLYSSMRRSSKKNGNYLGWTLVSSPSPSVAGQ